MKSKFEYAEHRRLSGSSTYGTKGKNKMIYECRKCSKSEPCTLHPCLHTGTPGNPWKCPYGVADAYWEPRYGVVTIDYRDDVDRLRAEVSALGEGIAVQVQRAEKAEARVSELKAEVGRLEALMRDAETFGDPTPSPSKVQTTEALYALFELLSEQDEVSGEHIINVLNRIDAGEALAFLKRQDKQIYELETELNNKTECLCGSDESVTCCRCGQIRKSKNTFRLEIGKDKHMCWLCARKHYRGMELLLEQEKNHVVELEGDIERANRTHGITITVGRALADEDEAFPANRFKADVVDVGHADYLYLVESEELNKVLESQNARVKELECVELPAILWRQDRDYAPENGHRMYAATGPPSFGYLVVEGPIECSTEYEVGMMTWGSRVTIAADGPGKKTITIAEVHVPFREDLPPCSRCDGCGQVGVGTKCPWCNGEQISVMDEGMKIAEILYRSWSKRGQR